MVTPLFVVLLAGCSPAGTDPTGPGSSPYTRTARTEELSLSIPSGWDSHVRESWIYLDPVEAEPADDSELSVAIAVFTDARSVDELRSLYIREDAVSRGEVAVGSGEAERFDREVELPLDHTKGFIVTPLGDGSLVSMANVTCCEAEWLAVLRELVPR